jgi:hypothetical protein
MYLNGLGWPEPVTTMSGNGYWLLYQIAVEASIGGDVPGRRVTPGSVLYLDRLRALRESKESLEVNASGAMSAEVALAWLRALTSTWSEADVPEAKAEVLHAIYERIVVTGRTIVSIRLTPSAYAHGLAVALPDKVALARPTGVGRAITTYEMPIEGRDEWVAAAKRLA